MYFLCSTNTYMQIIYQYIHAYNQHMYLILIKK